MKFHIGSDQFVGFTQSFKGTIFLKHLLKFILHFNLNASFVVLLNLKIPYLIYLYFFSTVSFIHFVISTFLV